MMGFPGGSDGKESACNMGDLGSIPGLGRSPGEGSSYPLQCSCLENSMDREPGGLQSMGLQTQTPRRDFHFTSAKVLGMDHVILGECSEWNEKRLETDP